MNPTADKVCCKCNKYLKKIPGSVKIINTCYEAEKVKKQLKLDVKVGNKMCDKCRRLVFFGSKLKNIDEAKEPIPSTSTSYRQQFSSDSQTSTSESNPLSQGSFEDPTYRLTEKEQIDKPTVELPLKRSVATHRACFLCRNSTISSCIVIPIEARLQCFAKRRIFIPQGNRICLKHLINKKFYEDELEKIEVYAIRSTLYIDEISLFIDKMADSAENTLFDKVGSMQISAERVKVLTGFSYEQLTNLNAMLTSMRQSETRSSLQALIIFLFKLRSGNSNATISSIFNLDREKQVSDFSMQILKSFKKDILSSRFGPKNLLRQNLIENHTAPFARCLYNIKDELALIFDGTYLKHQKSKNNDYQKKSYSGQKKAPLCKPFTITTTDGYIVDIPGPFLANMNDASIMRKVLQDPEGVRSLMKPGDICIVDRGFRDVVPFLQSLKFRVLMPAFKGKRAQLTTLEANESRFVTKLRWVVEAVHGILGQKFKLLHHQLDNKLLPTAATLCRIACYLQNEFGKRLNSDIGMQDEIVQRMKNLRNNDNSLAVEVENANWSRRSSLLSKLKATDLDDFPELTDRDLKIFFAGTYQLGQAVSYLAEMLDEKNDFNIEYVKMQPNIVMVSVRSRHINNKTYKCYVHYNPKSFGYNAILRHTCNCPNGLRTVGCCSHLATVIYYLSNARYKSSLIKPSKVLSQLFAYEEVDPVINENSDED